MIFSDRYGCTGFSFAGYRRTVVSGSAVRVSPGDLDIAADALAAQGQSGFAAAVLLIGVELAPDPAAERREVQVDPDAGRYPHGDVAGDAAHVGRPGRDAVDHHVPAGHLGLDGVRG